MMIAEGPNKSPQNPSKRQAEIAENGQKNENLFSPRFRSVAAMAGWDEEALLIASLIVEDTPDRQSKHKKRSDLHSLKTPPTNSRRKRRAQRRSPVKIPVTVLDLDEDEPTSKQESEKPNNKEANCSTEEAEKKRVDDVSSSTPAIPCIDRLREELSCAICLEICYEPSTTPCGHSFCKKCLRSSADKCGKKCPKCRQLISNGRYCTVNTVLWNTIQLLFPQEVEARKAAASASTNETPESRTPPRTRSHNTRNRPVQALLSPESEINNTSSDRRRNHHHHHHNHHRTRTGNVRMRRELPSQDEDAALALRLQREEFLDAFRVPVAVVPNDESNNRRNSLATARANLRAMASRAVNIRIRGRTE